MVTLTGTFTRLDGTPATGTVRVTPSRSPIMDPDGKVVISGPQVFPLGVDGTLSVTIPASNDPDLGPPFTYWIDVNLTHASWKINKVWIPHGSTTVDLSEIADYTPTPGVATRVVTIPADGTDGQVLVWDGAGFSWMDAPEGPQGPPGEVTTAQLTTALAGKVTGTGMTLRRDTTVGTRVFLDHPGGTTMLWGDTGWRNVAGDISDGFTTASGGRAVIRRTNNTLEVNAVVTVAPDAPFIGENKVNNRSVLNLPAGFRPLHLFGVNGVAVYANSLTFGTLGSDAVGLRVRAASGVWSAGETLIVQAVYGTGPLWPTSLPGNPV